MLDSHRKGREEGEMASRVAAVARRGCVILSLIACAACIDEANEIRRNLRGSRCINLQRSTVVSKSLRLYYLPRKVQAGHVRFNLFEMEGTGCNVLTIGFCVSISVESYCCL
jgi:hypothetical protein